MVSICSYLRGIVLILLATLFVGVGATTTQAQDINALYNGVLELQRDSTLLRLRPAPLPNESLSRRDQRRRLAARAIKAELREAGAAADGGDNRQAGGSLPAAD